MPASENGVGEGEMIVDETSAENVSPELRKPPATTLVFIEEMGRLAYRDANVTVYPVRASSSQTGKPVYSFVCVPAQTRGKFLPQVATKLGCKPKEHFRILTAGQPVTLDDGTIVTPDMVTDKPL